MIAPLRETETRLDENARLLARARRAVASALLQEAAGKLPCSTVPAWQTFIVTAWALAVAASSVGLFIGWWKLVPF